MNFVNYNVSKLKQKKEDILYLNTFRSRTQPLEGYTIFKGYAGTYHPSYISYLNKKRIPQVNDCIIGILHYQNIDTSKPNFDYQSNCCKFHLKEEEMLNFFCYLAYNRDMSEILNSTGRRYNFFKKDYLIFKVLLHPEDILIVNKRYSSDYDENYSLSIMARKLIVTSKKLSFKILSRKYIIENNNEDT